VSIAKTVRRYERNFDRKAEQFLWHHPLLGFLAIFIGVPIFVLACVCIGTVILAFPMAWLLGWL